MNLQRPLILILLGTTLALGACGTKTADDSKVLVTVNGEPITEKDYESYLQLRHANQPPLPDKERERKIVLDEMVNRLLLTQGAIEQKLDQEPDVYFQIKRFRENTLARALIRKQLKDLPVTDNDLRQRYTQEVEKTHKTEYRARHILMRTEEEAREAIKQLKGGANFAKLAKDKSIDVRSAREGGDLGWFNQGMMVAEFFDAVTKMKKGELGADPVKSEFGWHVIRLEDSRPFKIPPFEQIRNNVQQLIQQERIDALVQQYKNRGKIEYQP